MLVNTLSSGETDISEILGVRAKLAGEGGEWQFGGMNDLPFFSVCMDKKRGLVLL